MKVPGRVLYALGALALIGCDDAAPPHSAVDAGPVEVPQVHATNVTVDPEIAGAPGTTVQSVLASVGAALEGLDDRLVAVEAPASPVSASDVSFDGAGTDLAAADVQSMGVELAAAQAATGQDLAAAVAAIDALEEATGNVGQEVVAEAAARKDADKALENALGDQSFADAIHLELFTTSIDDHVFNADEGMPSNPNVREAIAIIWDRVEALTEHAMAPCPSGMVSVNDLVCVEEARSGTSDWHTAILDCRDRRARLCSPAEFHLYCLAGIGNDLKLPSLGVSGPEWVDAIAGTPPQYLAMSGATCDTMSPGGKLDAAHYRCCTSIPPLLELP